MCSCQCACSFYLLLIPLLAAVSRFVYVLPAPCVYICYHAPHGLLCGKSGHTAQEIYTLRFGQFPRVPDLVRLALLLSTLQVC